MNIERGVYMIVNYASQEVIKGKKSIFLAGPTPRSNDVISWRGEAINILTTTNKWFKKIELGKC